MPPTVFAYSSSSARRGYIAEIAIAAVPMTVNIHVEFSRFICESLSVGESTGL